MVHAGEARGNLVIPQECAPSVRALAEYFIHTIERSTGAKLPLITDEQAETLPAETPRIYLGSCRQTATAGLHLSQLPPEGYQLIVRDQAVYVLGEPAGQHPRPFGKSSPWYDSDPMRWALNHLLEDQIGVRWLWPGELGTYVPSHPSFAIPAKDRSYQPKLKMRTFFVSGSRYEMKSIRNEAFEWMTNHQGGERDSIPLHHGFKGWWQRFHETHPDYFAEAPEGVSPNPPRFTKLRLGNPDVVEQIARDYVEAGKPKYWSITPPDGLGFDTGQIARSWDLPTDLSPLDIWTGKVNLTPRYVAWWNHIYERLVKINPDVVVVTMAYSVYRQPPPAQRPLTAKSIIGIVTNYRDYNVWGGWMKHTDEMILRPNWGHHGANGPHLPLKEMAAHVKYAWKHQMIGFYLDSVLGFWSTQGMNYYLLARLMTRPELSVEEIINEYASAFGEGAPKVKEYIQYWQNLSSLWAHGHKRDRISGSLYDALIEEKKIRDNPMTGPREALPYIYTDQVLAKAYALLNEADRLTENGSIEVKQRMAFLRDGLDELRATRDCLALASEVARDKDPDRLKEFYKKAKDLEVLRNRLTPSHAIWGDLTTRREDKYKIKIRPRNMGMKEWDGEEQF